MEQPTGSDAACLGSDAQSRAPLSGLYSLASLLPSDVAASVPSFAHSLGLASVLSRLSRLALDLQAEQPIDDGDDNDGHLTTDILRRTIPGIVEHYNFP